MNYHAVFLRSRKYAKWWQQCYLAGINHMLLGFRNDYGVVECLQPLGVKDIEMRAKTWSASSFISFLDEFCSFVRRTITKDWSHEENDVHLFYYSPNEKKIKWRISNEEQYQFLPDWFINEFS
ncbi:unnamed protein product [Rotaria magnacalcarata]|uniref:Decapping nuclease n=1 Tax=Rotaria magnacalcarata TaxID=392030 RepID=A0A8S2K5T4_9BILA|nr:unnamed protein product [Rotaria magnacalcarata]CAF3943099.1 unnamed protein product [Rotaria magnacalcarata]